MEMEFIDFTKSSARQSILLCEKRPLDLFNLVYINRSTID